MLDGNTTTAVAEELEAVVAAARPGDRLPSVRDLMRRHGAGPATVQRAVHQLVGRGLVEARPGRGTFVARGPAAGAPAAPDHGWQTVALGARTLDAGALEDLLRLVPPGTLALSFGYLPEDLQPRGALGQALGRAARRPGAWAAMPAEGLAPLRALLAARLGGGHAAEDVIVTDGGQSALAACLRGLAPPGGAVVVESPTYLGALAAARAANLVPVPVPSDAGGVRPDLLAGALAASGAKLVYLQPAIANPHGAVLAPDRRADVLAAVRAAGAFLIEDDAMRELAFAPERLPPPLAGEDPDGHVVHIGSLTKVAAPGLRIGVIAARGPALARLRAARVVEDFFVPGPLQEAAVELLGSPAWPRHLRRLRAGLRERRDALLAAIDDTLGPGRVVPPAGGMHAWVRLDAGEDDIALAERAYAAGVKVFAGRHWFPAEPPGPHLRITYAAEPPDRLREGMRLLASVR